MQRSGWVFLLSLILCPSVFSQDSGIIVCDSSGTRVPAWTAPGSANVMEQLSCGQTVSILGLERSFWKIQIGDRVAYVDAKYVRLSGDQQQAQQTLRGNQSAPPSKVRVFVTDSQSWEMRGASTGFGNATDGVMIVERTKGGARPQNAEIAKTFKERCPQLTITNDREKADYILTLDHEGGKGLARIDNKWVVYNESGDMLDAGSTRSLGNSVKDACAAILNEKSE
jgi:hypothetical protein